MPRTPDAPGRHDPPARRDPRASAPIPLSWEDGPVVIGEVGQAHDGSLGTAHAFIDAIADAGADAVKFQTHIAAAESHPSEPWRVRFSYEDATRFDYWRRMEFSEEGWIGLRAHAEERGLAFLSSPFSLEAVELLQRVGVAAWKIASGEVPNLALLRAVAAAGGPVLLSSGMSPWDELDRAVAVLRAAGAGPLAVLQCTSSYPVAPEALGLNVLGEIPGRYGCPAGLSDHSGTIAPGIAAAALGARVIEIHVTLAREMFGPDVPASVTPSELKTLCDGVRFIGRSLAHPVDKDVSAAGLEDMRRLFTRSLVTRRPLAAGEALQEADLAARKPGSGIPAQDLPKMVGRRLRHAVDVGTMLTEEDLLPTSGA